MHRKKKKKKKKEERNTQPIQTTITTTTTFQLTTIVRRLAGSGYRNRFSSFFLFSFIAERVCVCVYLAHKVGENDQLFEGFSLSQLDTTAAWARWWWWWPWKKRKKIVVRSAISYLSPAHQFRNSFLHCVISSRKTHHSAPLFEFFRFQKIVENLPAVCSITKNAAHHQLSKKKKCWWTRHACESSA